VPALPRDGSFRLSFVRMQSRTWTTSARLALEGRCLLTSSPAAHTASVHWCPLQSSARMVAEAALHHSRATDNGATALVEGTLRDALSIYRVSTQLFRTGVALAIGVTLHNFPEGIAVFLTSLNGIKLV
jgi:zinc transporter ZupT